MKIEIGKKYLLKNGNITTIVAPIKDRQENDVYLGQLGELGIEVRPSDVIEGSV